MTSEEDEGWTTLQIISLAVGISAILLLLAWGVSTRQPTGKLSRGLSPY
jgi:hypothetical protein